ncbi:MAG: TolC family protein [Armatimonadota bacterium]|nr:TolC family protein [Armatimonadota bacterium]
MTPKFRSTAFLLLCICLSVQCSQAQQGETNKRWSLEECINSALQNQVDVLIARNQVIRAQAQYSKALSNYFPQVRVENIAFTGGSASGVLSQTTTGTAVSVAQNLFDGGLREASVSAARYGVRSSEAQRKRVEQTIVYNVTRAYFELLRAKRLAEVARKNVEYNEALFSQVQAMVEKGEAAAVDLLPVKAQLANARVSLVAAENQVRTAAIELQNQMGFAPRSDFDVAEPTAPVEFQVQSLDAYISAALQIRPDVLQRAADLQAARAQRTSARISLYPRPYVTAEYQHRVSGGYRESASQIIGGFVFDVFNGGANQAAYREAEIQFRNAQLEAQQIEKDIRAEVEEAYLNLTSAKERLVASEVSLEAATENYEAQKERYAQGSGTTLDMLNAEVQLVTAQTGQVQAQYDYYVAIAQLKYATGTIWGGRNEK